MARNVHPEPRDVSTEDTLAYMQRWLPKRGRILEVGCGAGALAKRLIGLGHTVVAIDAHPDAVKAAKKAGVPAVLADGQTYEDDPFDAVLYTRSLHHVEGLAQAVRNAHALTKPGGRLILEEFAYRRIDAPTARWFYDTLELLEAAGCLQLPEHWHHAPKRDVKSWLAWHEHHGTLHPDTQMKKTVAKHYEVESEERVPYLFRYAPEWLEKTEDGIAAATWLKERETRHIADGALVAIGWRLVASRPR